MARLRGALLIVALFVFAVLGSSLVAGSSHEDAESTVPTGCTEQVVSDIDLYSHAMVKERWDRALAVAPNACLMPLDGNVWECYYAEAVPGLNQRLCFYPVPVDLTAGAPPRLDVSIDILSLREMADQALAIAEVQQLVGSGRAKIDVRVEDDAARFIVENYVIVDAFYVAPPNTCTPFDLSQMENSVPADVQAVWQAESARALGVCATTIVPASGHCEHVARVPGTRSFLCWWGLSEHSGEPDFRFDISADALRAVLNAEDPGAVAKAALARANIVVWADDVFKRAALKAALETLLGDVEDLQPPPADTVNILGREFIVTYFPRNGVMTPCARDGQGTWYWLNEFGVPNGFVGTSTVEAMKRVLATNPNPSEEDLLNDLYLNWKEDGLVVIDGVEVPIEYIFVPGSPFSLLPVAKKPDGSYVHLSGDGSYGDAVTVDVSLSVEKQVAAADIVGSQVDFNQQPGTLSQDLKFLAYAVQRNPAAPQIAALLESLANGTKPVTEDVAGLFPPESPRLTLGAGFQYGNVSAAVAEGDAFALGMATHYLLWNDLLRYGAIESDEEGSA